jgi:hypothetical protein
MLNRLAHKAILKKALQNVIASEAFWSFDINKIESVPDENLIEAVLVHGNDPLRKRLLDIYSKRMVRRIWEKKVVIRGNNYQFLNQKIASDLLKISNPEEYIKQAYSKYNLYDRLSSSHS